MKEKSFVNSSSPYFHKTFQLRYLPSVKCGNRGFLKRLLRRYQKEIDTTCAAMIIGTMFLIGIWRFLVQLAEY